MRPAAERPTRDEPGGRGGGRSAGADAEAGKAPLPDVAPVAGDTLVFPDNAAQKTNVNNFKFPHFNSLKFTGSGYTVSGTLFLLSLDFGIVNSATSGANSYNGPINLGNSSLSSLTINAAFGGNLFLGGVLSGSAGIRKTGQDTLTLNGASANTYTGLTFVSDGLLQLEKGDATGPRIAALVAN